MNIDTKIAFPFHTDCDFDMAIIPMDMQEENSHIAGNEEYSYYRSWSCLVVWYHGKRYARDMYTEDTINEFWDILRACEFMNGTVFMNDLVETTEAITEPYKRILSYTNGYVYVGEVPTLSLGRYE